MSSLGISPGPWRNERRREFFSTHGLLSLVCLEFRSDHEGGGIVMNRMQKLRYYLICDDTKHLEVRKG